MIVRGDQRGVQTDIDQGELAPRVAGLIRDVPDHPRPGVVFKDITPLLVDGPAFGSVVTYLAQHVRGEVDVVVGMEARGFIFGAPVAVELGVGFVPVRKEGKLPRTTLAGAYELEYGNAVIELHADAIHAGTRVLVVDDVLATGGTAAATLDLLDRLGAEVVGVSFVMELAFLRGREKLAGRRVDSLVTF